MELAKRRTAIAEMVQGNSAFALDLYHVLRAAADNLFFSPYSVSLALAMTYAGARGETEAQMARALHFQPDQERLHAAFRDLRQALDSRRQAAGDRFAAAFLDESPPAARDGAGQGEGGFRLHIANALWGAEGETFLADFLTLLREAYGGGLERVDFVRAPEQARVTINAWVEEQTEGRIRDLIPAGLIDSLTRLVLTNAIYFKASWAEPFQPELTRDGPFHPLEGSPVTVPLMQRTASYGYTRGEGYQGIELPYYGGELSMLILLPERGAFEAFERELDPGRMAGLPRRLAPRQVALTMPRFRVESAFRLDGALSKLGMPLAFSEKADFSGMTGERDLFISAVVHKAFVDVDEAGTEAAAATAVIMGRAMAPEEPLEVRVDRPFLFLIRDIETGTVLFVGRVVDAAA